MNIRSGWLARFRVRITRGVAFLPMSTAGVVVRYDGPMLQTHRMDVNDLAPALLGISELCKIANKRFNGDRASVQVLISADQEQQCFQFGIDIVQTLWQHAQNLIGGEGPKSADEILKIIGLAGGGVYGLIRLVALLKGRTIEKTSYEVKDGSNVATFNIKGDNNRVYYAHPEALDLLRDPGAQAQVRKIVQPVTRPGINRLEFETQDGLQKETITAEEAEAITALGEEGDEPQEMDAWVKVYAPVYDPAAKQWQFQFLNGHAYMDISDTDIAGKAIERGGALAEDTYKVRLQVQQLRTPTGQLRAKYKILKVLEFHPAQIGKQPDLGEKRT